MLDPEGLRIRFLRDYRGVLTDEIFYTESQVVEVDAPPSIRVAELLEAGHIEIVGEKVVFEDDDEASDLFVEDEDEGWGFEVGEIRDDEEEEDGGKI